MSIGLPILRLRSDEQLVALFRGGNEDAFRVIHDRYRQRLLAYTRQMLPGSVQDAEDALQDVFVRAYANLRSSDRDLALRAWLYRVAHNRCIDELRRPPVPTREAIEFSRGPSGDPIAEAEQRETLRRLIQDIRRLPEQQRSALLMRELSGMSYTELAAALCVSVPAVKSLLVRARIGLAKALEARDTACSAIHEELVLAHDRGVRPSGTARRHLRDCEGCREFRGEVRGFTRQFAALAPALGPAGMLAKLMGVGGGAGGGAAGGSAAMAGGAAGTGGMLTAGGLVATGATHVATLLAAAVITAGGAGDLARSIAAPVRHPSRHQDVAARVARPTGVTPTNPSPAATVVTAAPASGAAAPAAASAAPASALAHRHGPARRASRRRSHDPSLPASLDQGTFGMPTYSATDGSQAPAAGTGSGVSGSGTGTSGTTPGTTGPDSNASGASNGSPTGSGSPSPAGTGISGSSTSQPLGTGTQPVASTSSVGSNASSGAGSGSGTNGSSSGGPSSSTTG